MKTKNERHRELYLQYVEVKHRITITQRMLENEKNRFWCHLEDISKFRFIQEKRANIEEYKYLLGRYHAECRELKKLIYLEQIAISPKHKKVCLFGKNLVQ